MRKPKLTRRVLRGILDVLLVVESGGPADIWGWDNAETRKQYADAMVALGWVNDTICARDSVKVR